MLPTSPFSPVPPSASIHAFFTFNSQLASQIHPPGLRPLRCPLVLRWMAALGSASLQLRRPLQFITTASQPTLHNATWHDLVSNAWFRCPIANTVNAKPTVRDQFQGSAARHIAVRCLPSVRCQSDAFVSQSGLHLRSMSTAARTTAAMLAPATTLQQGESRGREARH